MTLKELRMWHWRKMTYHSLTNRQIQSDDDFTALAKDTYSSRHIDNAEFHLSAVEALNAVVPGSVEQDIADDEKAKAVFVGIQESKAFTVEAAAQVFGSGHKCDFSCNHD